jgi:hypothetical protein
MSATEKFKRNLKRISKFNFYLFFAFPIALSLLIHLAFLYYSNFIRWGFYGENRPEREIVATAVVEKKEENKLQFQEANKLDAIKSNPKKVPSEKASEYKSEQKKVLPDAAAGHRSIGTEVDFNPETKTSNALDLIGVPAGATDHRWLISSPGRQPMHTGTEQLSAGSFSRHIQELREGGLDVVFVFDATVSMGRCIQQVKHKIANLTKTYKKLVPTCRIGMVAYRDYGEEFVTKSHPLTFGILSLEEFLSGIQAEGGEDREEAVEEGLRVAIDEINWNKDSNKIILLIGDAPPHQKDMSKAVELIKKFHSTMNGKLATLDTSLPIYYEDWYAENKRSEKNMAVMEEFQIFAEVGGGESARLVNEEKVVKQMLVLVFGGRWEMYLNEFMKNL